MRTSVKHFTHLLPLKQQVLHPSVSTFYPRSDKLQKVSSLLFVEHSLVFAFLKNKVGTERAFLTVLQLSECPTHTHTHYIRQNIVSKTYSFGAFILELVIIWMK